MTLLILGLALFLAVHSVRLFADGWRTRQIARVGTLQYRIGHSVLALAGLVLIVIGYAQARLDPLWLWQTPIWTRHLAALLTLPAFLLLAAACVPGTHLKARISHPLLAAVKLWALAHLLANNTLADLLLFGGFLVWSVAAFAVSRRRDRREGKARPAAAVRNDAIAVVLGVLAWGVMARFLHAPLFGVAPFGG
ncbi:NnrU family protein [Pseudothauera nasutitermitis]|uniref:NnrU family protein n=1 Tax=Pseudothauera nasutitermitis TaxID=2565930 RepID=A0A4S4B3Y4_9RHOO|nr:NnrU family protein [Pseudothauera nasutitermitis]THF66440.1 NnrU family protein [Pseudothauera nasutitermitis]